MCEGISEGDFRLAAFSQRLAPVLAQDDNNNNNNLAPRRHSNLCPANGLDKTQDTSWGSFWAHVAKFTTPFIKSMHNRCDRLGGTKDTPTERPSNDDYVAADLSALP
ncbi:hypothetical protein ACLKA6_002471 [Drosophila palustris]